MTSTAGDGRSEQDIQTWLARRERTLTTKGIHNGLPLNVAVQAPTPHASAGPGAGYHGTGAPNLQTVVSDLTHWHTPSAGDANGSRTLPPGTTPTGRLPDGRKVMVGLNNDVRHWSTPTAQDAKNATLPRSQAVRDTLPGDVIRELRDVIRDTANIDDTLKFRAELSPDWVEALQGLPAGWTDVDAQGVASDLAAFRGWPTGPAESQHEWEPPRTLPRGKARHGQKRLTALGNLVVPLQFAPIFAAIVETERRGARGGY